jgi:hypothetical protein
MPPPDENTAVDPTGAVWVVWLVIVPPVQAARLAEDTVARAVEQLEVESLVDDLEARLTGGAA